MIRISRFSKTGRGFTLVELAIVVGITGLLFGGLWRLLASGNSQLREQSAADQMNQLVGATRNFLASAEGQTLLTGLAANGVQQLALPAAVGTAAGTAGCPAALNLLVANTGTYCNYLPAGFWAGAGGTNNAYNQSYSVFVRKDGQAAGTVAQSYNFLIVTTGGDVIPDSSGGRIAANIGANGGFIYSNLTCGTVAANFACGSFGSYTLDITAAGVYGATGGTSGHIVTENSSAISTAANTKWLARIAIPGDLANPRLFNTMQVPLEMQAGGAAQINMRGNTINMNAGAGGVAGFINLEGGVIGGVAGAAGPGIITLTNTDGTTPLTVDTFGAAAGTIAAQVNGENCDTVDGSGGFPACQPALNVGGSANLARSLNVAGNASVTGTLQAGVFIYSSDVRYKKDLVPLTNELDRLAQLQPYHFKWRKNDRADIGVIAQDVQKLYPELVHVGNNGKLGVEYGNLVAPLIQAVKELRLQNIVLKEQLAAQEKRLKALEE